MKVTIFSESTNNEQIRVSYPNGMNAALVEFIEKEHEVTFIEQTYNGANQDGTDLTEEILKNTDVLVWWGHGLHYKVADSVVNMVVDYVNRGMGFLALHSAHESKPMQRLLGTTGALSWREIGENERVWILDRTHPIVRGLNKPYIDIEHEEMYGEPFNIPTPDELIMVSWFRGGEIMRSGCVWKRGLGKMFYFRPGHETFPTFYHPDVQKVILNAIEYLAPVMLAPDRIKSERKYGEDIPEKELRKFV